MLFFCEMKHERFHICFSPPLLILKKITHLSPKHQRESHTAYLQPRVPATYTTWWLHNPCSSPPDLQQPHESHPNSRHNRLTQHPSKSEIAQLHNSSRSYQNVLRFDVPVDAAMLVAIPNGLDGLPDNLLREQIGAPARVPFQFVEHRALAELEHQVEAALPAENFQEVDQIRVLQVLEAKAPFRERKEPAYLTPGTFNSLISLRAIFLMSGSSSLSENFLMATISPVSLFLHL